MGFLLTDAVAIVVKVFSLSFCEESSRDIILRNWVRESELKTIHFEHVKHFAQARSGQTLDLSDRQELDGLGLLQTAQ